jgi:serine/threonine protein phosphatase PrpC
VDIQPGSREQKRLWNHIESGFAAVAVWTERISGRGEDADPLVLFHRPSGTGLVAVFDGVGGAGRTRAGYSATGFERTQAWIASRRMRGLVEEWFVSDRGGSAKGLALRMASRLAIGLARQGRIRGSIHREFPTTFAGLRFCVAGAAVRWEVLWAGDSRCYVAEPGPGLQQLSQDDTEPGDALTLLIQDPPMTNVISTSRDFAINRWCGRAALPCVLICATDGFFGYVDTPAQFEHLLWDTLLSARDGAQWAALLAERVTAYTSDDASLGIIALGFRDFDELRDGYRTRADLIRAAHAEPMLRICRDDQASLAAAREQSWRTYRGSYERRLPRSAGEIA